MFGEGDFFTGWGNFILFSIILIFAVWVLSAFLKSNIGRKIIYKFEPVVDWYSGLSFGSQKFFRVTFFIAYIAACFLLIVYISS